MFESSVPPESVGEFKDEDVCWFGLRSEGIFGCVSKWFYFLEVRHDIGFLDFRQSSDDYSSLVKVVWQGSFLHLGIGLRF